MQEVTLGAIMRKYKPDYPAEFLRAAHQTDCPYVPNADEYALVERRWAELRDDINNHVMSKNCSGSFSMLFGGARWNAELAEREAVHVVQKTCWPVNMAEGLDHEANPLYPGWAEMQRWGLREDLLLTLRSKPHQRLDQPELWLDVKALPV